MSIKKSPADFVQAVKTLIQQQNVGTQEEMTDLLKKQGYSVNQVKISRVLHKLGAIKMIESGQTVYRLPTERMTVTPSDSLKHLVMNIAHNDALIVIQTTPGSAQLVARLLDQKKEIGILGTVAGDDTIFIAPLKTSQIQTVFQKIFNMLSG